jgi:hypothetical protein
LNKRADPLVDRIYASLRSKQQSSKPATIAQAPAVPTGQTSTTTALESSTEGLLKRAAAGVVEETQEGENSSGASTPGLMSTPAKGVSSGKVCRGISGENVAHLFVRTHRGATRRRERESRTRLEISVDRGRARCNWSVSNPMRCQNRATATTSRFFMHGDLTSVN